MGRLSCEPRITHFAHHHTLELTSFDSSPPPWNCAGCMFPAASGSAYSCKTCGYVLHVPCAQLPHRIRHPAHPGHSLTLLPVPAYAEGSFVCNACGCAGSGFSYHCKTCGDDGAVDFHGLCASMPLSTLHPAHGHPLTLVFHVPYEDGAFSCDVCAGAGASTWLYRCAMCEFDAHVECATAAEAPQPSPATPSRQAVPRATQARAGVMRQSVGLGRGVMGVNNGGETLLQGMYGPGRGIGGGMPPQRMYGAGRAIRGGMLPQGVYGAGSGIGADGGLMNQMIQGFVSGAAKQAVQGVLGIGGGDGDGSGASLLMGAAGSAASALFSG